MPSTTLGYDPNGNVTIRGTQVLAYTPAEKVRTLDGPGVALSLVENLGTEKILHFHTPGENVLELDRAQVGADEERDAQTMLIRVIDDRRYSEAEPLALAFPVEKLHVFDPDTHEAAAG